MCSYVPSSLISVFLYVLMMMCVVHRSNGVPFISEHKIALLHLHDDAPFFSDLGALTLSNKRRYAIRHGYEMVLHTSSETEGLFAIADCSQAGAIRRHDSCYVEDKDFAIDERAATFGKIKLAINACRGRKGYWMLWSDADAMIVNQSIALTDVIDDRFDMGLTVDWLMINAGVMLIKCSKWSVDFLKNIYKAREFDKAQALDQSAIQYFVDNEKNREQHVQYMPKWSINVYTEEYRAGDFILHMAGKLYEATTGGALAVAHQFDILSRAHDIEDVKAFFHSQYFLNFYSGICVQNTNDAMDSECKPEDARRRKLNEALASMSSASRYRHVAMRYYWLQNWKDEHDVGDWGEDREMFDALKQTKMEDDYNEKEVVGLRSSNYDQTSEETKISGQESHDEL